MHRALLGRHARIDRMDRIDPDRASFIPPVPYFRSPYLRPHTFGFADPYPTSTLSLSYSLIKVLSQFVVVGGTRALVHSRRGPAGAMRCGHAAPALGGLASSAGASQRPQVSRSTSLPAPVVERPVAGRLGARAIWVWRVTFFFPGDFRSPCVGDQAQLFPNPAFYRGLDPCA